MKDSNIKVQHLGSKILTKIDATSHKLRDLEDQSKKFGLDVKSNQLFIALKGYKLGLQDILEDIKFLE